MKKPHIELTLDNDEGTTLEGHRHPPWTGQPLRVWLCSISHKPVLAIGAYMPMSFQLFLSLFLSAGGTQLSGLPLVVESVTIQDRHLQVTTRNVGDQIITAWGIDVTVWFTDGTSRRFRASTDGYESTLSTPPGARLSPGAQHGLRFPLALPDGRTASGTVAVPSFGVFEDGSAVGDRMLTDDIFRIRAANERLWRLVETRLSQAVGLPSQVAESVEADLLDAADSEIKASVAFREALSRLRALIRRAREGDVRVGQALTQLALEARQRSQLASQSRPRP